MMNQINETVLPTGLRIITGNMPGYSSSTVGAFVNVGARHETESQNGISHMIEHLNFKGTDQRTAHAISQEVEVLGSDLNAWTSMDMTTYHVTGLVDHLGKAVEIIGDMMTSSQFTDENIALESGVIMQEISRAADSPGSVAYNALQAVSFPDQAVGRTVLGSTNFVQNATRNDFLKFYREHYTADNMIVVGTGGIDHDDFVAKVADGFQHLPLSGSPIQQLDTARYVGGTSIDRSRDFKQVTASIGFRSVPVLDDRLYHHRLLADAFGGGMSSPLFIEIREKRGLVYSTGCYLSQGVDHGRLVITGGMTPDNVAEFVSVACAEFRKLCDSINAVDLERAKNSNLVTLATLKERPYSMACAIASSWWQRGRLIDLEETREKIEAVTLDDLRDAAAYVLSATPSIAMVGPVPEADYAALVQSAIT